MSDHATDAVFFDMIHSLLQEQDDQSHAEKRRKERHEYNCIQLLAPYDGLTLPSQADFQKVLCQDLSTSGFAFYSPRQPETKRFVVALGAIPFIFYLAEVKHVDAVHHDGVVEYKVGCQLKNRITRENNAADVLINP